LAGEGGGREGGWEGQWRGRRAMEGMGRRGGVGKVGVSFCSGRIITV